VASETVTVLFTDMVGSTAQRARLGDDAANALLREHDEIVRGAAERHGGRVVEGTGDGSMLAFEAAGEAVRAAVAIQQDVEQRNRRAVERIGLRIGLSLGDLAVGDDGVHGMASHEAARVCALADADEIFITDVVRLVAGSRLDDHEVNAHGTHELKGIAAPVTVWSVKWQPVANDEPKLPSRLLAAGSGNFVGRTSQFEQLINAWKAVSGDGQRRIVLLSGEPGIGKTTLSAKFAKEVCDEGALVLYGRCDEDLRIPYQPWIEALGQVIDALPDELLREHVADRGAHLARLIPQLAARLSVEVPPSGDGDTERFVLYGCVTDLLTRVSAEQPVLIVLDDLHWADRATVQLLRHVSTVDAPMRVAVLGTFRDSEITTDHPLTELLAALHRESVAERIALRGFGDDELLTLLETIAGHEMDEQGVALRDALLAETAGNPFFVAEILRHLAESGAIFQRDDGRWVADADIRAVGLPVSVREVIGRRLATLGPDTERILAIASVIGRDFDISLLATIARVDEDTVLDICDGAVAVAILQTTSKLDRYTFAHALIEHTLYDRLSTSRRARAHNAIAETLEAQCGDDPGDRTAELAYHWAAAVQPTDATKALHYAQLAGDRALTQLAPDEAIRWYSQALELIGRAQHPDERQKTELLVGLGEAQRQTGIAAYRETLLEAARLADQIDAVDLMVRAVLANYRGWNSVVGEGDDERIAAIDRALDRVGRTPSAARAQLLALAATERTYIVDLSARLALYEEAVEVARACGDQVALARTLETSIAIFHPSTLTQRTARAREACDIADRLDEPSRQYFARSSSLTIALERGDGGAIDANFHLLEELAGRVPHATIRWQLTYYQAWVAGLRGDLAEYERLAEAALTLGIETGQPDALRTYAPQLVNVRARQGRMDELIPLLENALADTPTLRAYRALLAAAKARANQSDQARLMIREDIAAGFPMPENTGWITGMAYWAETAVLVHEPDAAPVLRERLLAYHDQLVTALITFSPAVCHYLGLLDHLVGRYDDADAWFAEALELHQRVRSPVLIAYTQAAWAALLADRNQGNDHTRARAMAQAALDAAIAGGYGYVEADARAVLDRLS
jgi:class 3 adenylate cyclase/tetratricopeptide (TPR) repeat protein